MHLIQAGSISSVVPLRTKSYGHRVTKSETFPSPPAACRGEASCLVFLVLSQLTKQSQRQGGEKESF